MKKRFLAFAIMLISLLTAGILFAPQAQAATQVAHVGINNIGFLDVYWDGYRNYAYTRHAGGTYGVPLTTYVDICRSDRAGRCIDSITSDYGTYRYYAGPVYSNPSAGYCVTAKGIINNSGPVVWTGACG